MTCSFSLHRSGTSSVPRSLKSWADFSAAAWPGFTQRDQKRVPFTTYHPKHFSQPIHHNHNHHHWRLAGPPTEKRKRNSTPAGKLKKSSRDAAAFQKGQPHRSWMGARTSSRSALCAVSVTCRMAADGWTGMRGRFRDCNWALVRA